MRLTATEIRAILRVDESGALVRVAARGNQPVGSMAGSPHRDGYIKVIIDGNTLYAHRVVWLLTYGEWPAGQVDHIDGNRRNNLPSNLRLCTHSQNQANRAHNGKFKGVTFHKKCGRWQAQCGQTYLGLFTNQSDAARAYDTEAARRYGSFARLNFGGAA